MYALITVTAPIYVISLPAAIGDASVTKGNFKSLRVLVCVIELIASLCAQQSAQSELASVGNQRHASSLRRL